MFSEFSWLHIVYLLVTTHITILTVTIYLHRCAAHRSLTLVKPLEHFFRFWCWITTGQNTKEWAAVHRKHHAFCEKEQDPHSPKHYGIWTVLFKGVFLYKKEAQNEETLEKYGKFTPDDWIEHNLYKKHSTLGLIGLAILNIALFGLHGIWIYLFQILWIPFWAAGVVNGLGHFKGYRNFNTSDDSTNLSPIGLIIGGEELHNNHHAYPSSAKLSVKWYEFDIGWFWIRLFEILGWAKVNKVIELPKFNEAKQELTKESLEVFLRHKYFIFSLFKKYSKQQVVNQIKEVKFNNKILQKHSVSYLKKIFYDLSDALKAKENLLLSELLKNNVLKSIYASKEKLLKFWTDKTQTMETLKSELSEWCDNMKKEYSQSLGLLASKIYSILPEQSQPSLR